MKWNYVDIEGAGMQLGIVMDEGTFRKAAADSFKETCQSLIHWVSRLQRTKINIFILK